MSDATVVGTAEGGPVVGRTLSSSEFGGLAEGSSVTAIVGRVLGARDATIVGTTLGVSDMDGFGDGRIVFNMVGKTLGVEDSTNVVGTVLGVRDELLGDAEGSAVAAIDGRLLGAIESDTVGTAVGVLDGENVVILMGVVVVGLCVGTFDGINVGVSKRICEGA